MTNSLTEKAVEAIKMTSDKYGEDSVETEALMAKAMSTTNRDKRNTFLAKVAEDYKKRGLKKREDFVRNLMYPIPIKAAKIIYLCDKAIEKLRSIEKKLVALRMPGKPAAVFYHIGYLLERINDVKRIMMRMALTRKELTNLQIKIHSLTPTRITPGKPYPKYLQVVHRRNDNLREQIRQDMEQFVPYTVLGLTVALDIDRSTLIRYEAKGEFCNTIKKAKGRIEAYAEAEMVAMDYLKRAIPTRLFR